MIFDIVLEGGTIITMDAQSQILENHCIGIKEGIIHAIFPEGSSSYETKQKNRYAQLFNYPRVDKYAFPFTNDLFSRFS